MFLALDSVADSLESTRQKRYLIAKITQNLQIF